MARDAFRAVPLFLPAADMVRNADWRPSVDVYRAPGGWLVKCDLAGVRPQDVQLQLRGRTLLVCGARRDWLLEEGYCQYHMEISYSKFEREIDLPETISDAPITVEFRDGMLLVKIHTENHP